MSYSEDLKIFRAAHTYKASIVEGSTFHYVLSGKKDGKTLVLLNGGMNTMGMWMGYVDALSSDYQVLLFDYPQELRTNQELVRGMHAFFQELGITQPVFVGASDGGMVAQSNYEKMKPKLIKAGMSHIRNESKEEIAYAQDMFETIFKDYKQEKDVHISSLLADLMNQKPVTADDFAQLKGNILLILPDQDFFSGEMQKNLIQLMHNPEIQYVSGGHLSTVLKVDAYVRTIRDFLSKHQGK